MPTQRLPFPARAAASRSPNGARTGTAAPGEVELPTLTDASQQVAGLLGVSKTAEAVVLEPAAGGFAIRYRGAIDAAAPRARPARSA